jgi:hypothetical protein
MTSKTSDIKQVYQTPDDLRHTTSFSHVSILAWFLPILDSPLNLAALTAAYTV